MYLDIICEKGSALVNEDKANVIGNAAWVLDGATGLNNRNLTDDISDARWFVTWWNNYLTDNVNRDCSIHTIIKDGIHKINEEYVNGSVNNLSEIDMPSSSFSLIRWNNEKTELEYFVLGDCSINFSRSNSIQTILDENLVTLDNNVLSQMKILTSEEGLTLDEAKTKLMDKIIDNRNKKNKTNGYYILGFDEKAVDNAIYSKLTIDNDLRVLITSDGFSALFDKYNYITINDLVKTLKAKKLMFFYDELRKIENKDFNASKFPRFKKCDDASAIYIEF
ncbi:hypothetical protein JYG23_11270 [Sedimentibacter sp. zth1]|uniref:hypothetical protein n=1 Tax=Sedimentibacter sp. zth1 TaxID=2816908 RepID=UPI001A91919D|nr:hypothetical protein [Sedimentibacter sp. zth1]QSX05252.1 hypothetical protein JYG23_11270 [Sedimentibacter sp. zth1]